MRLLLKNNLCLLSQGESSSLELDSFLSEYLTVTQLVKHRSFWGRKYHFYYVKEELQLFTEIDGSYLFPRGLYSILGSDVLSNVEVVDCSTDNYSIEFSKLDNVETILQPDASFELREDQVMSVKKILANKRGIVQLPTGGGKTEVMAATIKYLVQDFPSIHVLVIEPTDVLVNKTSERFNRYHLNSKTYKEVRHGDLSGVNVLVSHPTSLLTDCGDNSSLLDDFAAVFWDECQHCRCDTWKSLNFYLRNVEYAIGLSALAVSEGNLYESDMKNLSLDEIMIIGATGRVIMRMSSEYYINQGILATPVIFQMLNKMEDERLDTNDWSKLRKYGIESEGRSELTARVTKMFCEYGRRVLILVGTKKQSEDIVEKLIEQSSSSIYIGVAYGSGESYSVDEDGIFDKYSGDIVHAFDNGDFNVLISTSHMDEGVDLSNLDVCILASGGKKDRRIIQRIGRALRLNKTGKYAYIVDFFDGGSKILESHSRLRMSLFTDLIKVPQDLVFRKLNTKEAQHCFLKLEGIKCQNNNPQLR